MSKRMTVGNRIAKKVGLRAFNNGCYFPQVVEAMVNAAIRRAKAKAWDDGHAAGWKGKPGDSNPYRGRER